MILMANGQFPFDQLELDRNQELDYLMLLHSLLSCIYPPFECPQLSLNGKVVLVLPHILDGLDILLNDRRDATALQLSLKT